MENTNQSIAKENLEKWQILGHEPIYERGVVRLHQFKKYFAPDVVVKEWSDATDSWEPIRLHSTFEELRAVDVLPERADMALDENGHLLHQGDFEQRYKLYLDAWVYEETADPNFEPIPNVKSYILEEPDNFSESRGYIPLKFDPMLNQEFKPEKLYGPDGETEEEFNKNKKMETINPLLEQILDGLTSDQKIEALEKMAAAQNIPIVNGNDSEESPEPMPVAAAPEPGAKLKIAAPCGGEYTEGYAKQHARHCKNPDCVSVAYGDGS